MPISPNSYSSGSGGGSGDVVGPASATANAMALFDGTTGKLVKAGGTVDPTVALGDVVGPASVSSNALALFDGTTGKLVKAGLTVDPTAAFVAGPTAVLNNALALFDGTTGMVKAGLTVDPTIAFGDVTGPAAVSDRYLAIFDGTTGKLLTAGPGYGTTTDKVLQLNASGKIPAGVFSEQPFDTSVPGSPVAGSSYFRVADNTLWIHNGSTWVSAGLA